MRHRPLLTTLASLTLLTSAAAPAAEANWLGLSGLNGSNGASWVREYATGTPPTTMYAATEAGGVLRSTNNGVTWAPYNSGLENIPGAKDVRTVFTSGTTVYAGTGAGLFKNTGGGFQPVAQGAEEDPKNPKKLNQAVQAVFTGALPGSPMLAGVASGGVYKSTDGGATWKPPAPGNGMVKSETVWSLGSFKDNGALIYAATQSGIYISADFGSTWTLSNDGISGVTLRAWADDKYPNIYYAGGSDGLFRSINAGLTWTKILGGTTVRAITQFNGVDTKRIYAGTGSGVLAGQTDLHPLPGKVKWRELTSDGLVNDIFWGLTSFVNTPGTLIGGTQGSGGYALTLFPPVHTGAKPTLKPVAPAVGKTLEVQYHGSWAGTQTIEFTYQWQDCTDGSCADITGETEPKFVIPAKDGTYRLKVIAQNDFPTGGIVAAYTDVTTPAAAKAGTFPGDNQANPGSIKVIPDTAFPRLGMTLQAQGSWFNPLESSKSYQWFHCVSAVNCTKIEGATGQSYLLTDRDVTKRLCVAVTGTNASGSKTLNCTALTNEIFPPDPQATSPTTLGGNAWVGHTLLSGVGSWAYADTRFSRRWERCNADGGSCEPLVSETKSTYVITAADLGKRLRARISVDTNQANKIPNPVEVTTPLSDVVTPEPVVQEPQNGGGGGGGGNPQPQPQPQPQPGPPPAGDKVKPVLKSAKAGSAKIKAGKALALKVNVSEAGSLAVVYRRGKKQVASFKVKVAAGARKVTLPKKKLAAGPYTAVITPVDAAGNRGASKTVKFRVVRR